MAEWIEIEYYLATAKYHASPLAMAEWIEIEISVGVAAFNLSPLAMAEWIEMPYIFVHRIMI